MERRRQVASIVYGASILLGACTSSPPPSGSTTSFVLPQASSIGARPICAIVGTLHQGSDSLVAARNAVHAGKLNEAQLHATDAQTAAELARLTVAALGQDPGDEHTLRVDVTREAANISQVASLYPMATKAENLLSFVDDPMTLRVTGEILAAIDSLAVDGADGTGGVCRNTPVGA